MRLPILIVTGVLLLAACSEPSTDAQPGQLPPEQAASPGGPQRLTVGGQATISVEGGKATVTVSTVRVARGPDGWGDEPMVFASVTIVATAGQVQFDSQHFTVISADGQHEEASTIASDAGLPERSLGDGTVAAPDTRKGLLAFDAPPSTVGARIEYAPFGDLVAVWGLG
jgi:hypothetical protein